MTKMEDVFVSRNYGKPFVGEYDSILVYYRDIIIRVPIPDGHSIDLIDVEFSRGDGWERPKEK